MKRKEFRKFIKAVEKQGEVCSNLYKSKVDLIEYDNMFHEIIEILASSHFTDDGWDLIQAWLYERPEDGSVWCCDDEDNPIPLNTPDDLYNYLKSNKWGIQ